MKIAIAMETFNDQKGGKEIFTWNLVRNVLDRGHEVLVVANTIQEIDHPNIEFKKASRRGKSLGLHRYGFAKSAQAILRQSEYDLSLTHGKAGFGDVVRVGGLPSRRFVEVMVDNETSWWRSWLERLKFNLSLSKKVAQSLERATFESDELGRVIVNCQLLKDEYLDEYPSLSNRQVEVIHNAIDSEQFNLGKRDQHRQEIRAELDLPDDAPVALFVGNDFQRKGIKDALNILKRSEGWYLLVAGRGEKSGLTGLTGSGLESRVRWLGEVEETIPYYAASDLFLLPSKTDGFSIATIEAMAMGLYQVLSPFCGSKEIIDKDWQGMILPPDFQTDLNNIPSERYRDSELIQDRADYAGQFTYSQTTDEYLRVFREILEERDNP